MHDPRDGTEVTFGALLEDVARYWGLLHADMAIVDEAGAVWPLEAYVWDELQTSADPTVRVVRRPNIDALGGMEIAYTEDESALPLAVRRRLDRERRQKQLEKHTAASIRKQKERERHALIMELVKCAAPRREEAPAPRRRRRGRRARRTPRARRPPRPRAGTRCSWRCTCTWCTRDAR